MSVDNGPIGVGRLVRLLDGGHLCIGVLENYTPSPVAGELGTYSCVVFGPATIDAVTSQDLPAEGRASSSGFGGVGVQQVAVVRLQKIRHVSDPYSGGWGQRFILAGEDAQILLDLGEKAAAVSAATPPQSDTASAQGDPSDEANAPDAGNIPDAAPAEPEPGAPDHKRHKHGN